MEYKQQFWAVVWFVGNTHTTCASLCAMECNSTQNGITARYAFIHHTKRNEGNLIVKTNQGSNMLKKETLEYVHQNATIPKLNKLNLNILYFVKCCNCVIHRFCLLVAQLFVITLCKSFFDKIRAFVTRPKL